MAAFENAVPSTNEPMDAQVMNFSSANTDASSDESEKLATHSFVPTEPQSLEETGLSEADVQALILKVILNNDECTGREIARQIKLPFRMIAPLMRSLKNQMFVNYKCDSIAGDYEYELTADGTAKARDYLNQCTYCGAAPVGLNEYRVAMQRQSLRSRVPSLEGLKSAYSDMLMSSAVLGQIGQAIASGRSLFVYGSPGNGKTSIAERAMSAINDTIWIPRSLSVFGQIIRIYDPNYHQEVKQNEKQLEDVDQRWIQIHRPTVIVGGELDHHHLELAFNQLTGIAEAPVQLKSNCGCLVVDDFGRQRVNETSLLNRWIIPLEKGYDIITLPSGSNFRVPFDQLVVFATNLNPRSLCDEAFLRRIPYKIRVNDPTPEQFKRLFLQLAQQEGIEAAPSDADYLFDRYFSQADRQPRFCHARDLIQQVRDFCRFHKQPMKLQQNYIDIAAFNYFGGIDA